jgi:hypothetical protein
LITNALRLPYGVRSSALLSPFLTNRIHLRVLCLARFLTNSLFSETRESRPPPPLGTLHAYSMLHDKLYFRTSHVLIEAIGTELGGGNDEGTSSVMTIAAHAALYRQQQIQ